MRQSETGENRKKLFRSFPAAILLAALYRLIFGFSAQDGEHSGNLSLRISQGVVEALDFLSARRISRQSQGRYLLEELALFFEHPIRKLAHFSEYACMGILLYWLLRPWMERGKKMYLLIVLWVFLSGALDEFHQIFVPDRWGSPADVLLDTLGGMFGLFLCTAASRLWRRFGRKDGQAPSLRNRRKADS